LPWVHWKSSTPNGREVSIRYSVARSSQSREISCREGEGMIWCGKGTTERPLRHASRRGESIADRFRRVACKWHRLQAVMTCHDKYSVASNKLNPETDPRQAMICQIGLKRHLGRQWTDWFGA